MQRILGVLARVAGAALLVGLFPVAAAAHEQREVAGGQYEMVVGFLDEPAFAGEKNGLDLRVSRTAAAVSPTAGGEVAEGVPVEGLADTLRAEVIFGEETMDLELEPAFGEPGAYESVFFPTEEGEYSFRIFGDIEGVAIDETFRPGPETFSAVESTEPLEFPKGNGAVDDGSAAGTIAGDVGGSSGGAAAIVALSTAAVLATGFVLVRHRGGARLRPGPSGMRLPVRS